MKRIDERHTKRCTCRYDSEGIRFGMCLACANDLMWEYGQGREKGIQQTLKDLEKRIEGMKLNDVTEDGKQIGDASAYNHALNDVLKEIKKGGKDGTQHE